MPSSSLPKLKDADESGTVGLSSSIRALKISPKSAIDNQITSSKKGSSNLQLDVDANTNPNASAIEKHSTYLGHRIVKILPGNDPFGVNMIGSL
jgi:hypothetical protein